MTVGLHYPEARIPVSINRDGYFNSSIALICYYYHSTSDGPEHIVENPMYGPSSHDVIHSGAEQYSSTGPDYEPMSRGPYDYSGAQVDNGGIVTQNENEYDHTSLNSVQV